MLEQYLQNLCSDLELPSPAPKDENKQYFLMLPPQIKVSLKELDPGYYLHATIGPCPTLKKEDLFIFLMKANFLGQGTGGSTIGLSDDENFLTLSLAIPYDMNYKSFRDTIEDFTNYIDYWKDELMRHQKAAESSLF